MKLRYLSFVVLIAERVGSNVELPVAAPYPPGGAR